MGVLARLRLAKIQTLARPNSPDMPPKRTKKVRLGISSLHYAPINVKPEERVGGVSDNSKEFECDVYLQRGVFDHLMFQ